MRQLEKFGLRLLRVLGVDIRFRKVVGWATSC